MRELENLPNIGKVAAEKLKEAGIMSPEELHTVGSEQAFIRMRAFDPTICFSMLCGIEGAIQGIRWHQLSKERKQELKFFINQLDKK